MSCGVSEKLPASNCLRLLFDRRPQRQRQAMDQAVQLASWINALLGLMTGAQVQCAAPLPDHDMISIRELPQGLRGAFWAIPCNLAKPLCMIQERWLNLFLKPAGPEHGWCLCISVHRKYVKPPFEDSWLPSSPVDSTFFACLSFPATNKQVRPYVRHVWG